MALGEVISRLNGIELSKKQEHYLAITKLLSENNDSTFDGLTCECVKNLCCSILNDFKEETIELPQLVKLLQSVFQNKSLQEFFPETEKQHIINGIVCIIDSSQHENVLVNCFSALIQVTSTSKLDNSVLNDLLERMGDILTKKNDPASTYSLCIYFQKILKEYAAELSNFVPVLFKLVFLPLIHPSDKVREVAEKNLDMFPLIILYTHDEQVATFLVKLVKETYSKDLLLLFKEKQEMYVLKVWTHVVKALGDALATNLPAITPFFHVIEKGFKSSVDEVCIASFTAWKTLIDNFAASGILNDSKKLRFILKPFKNISKSSENILLVACDAWMHLAWSLAGNLSSRFSEVCIPLLELTVGKIPNGLIEKNVPKGPIQLVKKSCYILLRFLEQPPSESFNRVSSPKKQPHIPYPALQNPVDIKMIIYHFKEILYVSKVILETFKTKEDMKPYLSCLMKSILFIVSSVIEDSNKESTEAVTCYLNFLTDIIEAKAYSSVACLKCLESLSKLPRKVLVSHCFNSGARKIQDILCTSLLKLLLNPYLFPSEDPKRFAATYNRLIQAGIHESFHPLSNAHKFTNLLKCAVGTEFDHVETLIEVWSGIAAPLLEVIEKTQEVNQGDKQEHDFSCMYDVLIFPFEFIFPTYVQQFRTRPAFKLWTCLYKAFIRCASLVATTSANEACEKFCSKLKIYMKEDLLKRPHFFDSSCLVMQSIIESVDFSTGTASGTQGIVDTALMIKRKKPLGNLTSFVDLLVILLKAYYTYYIEAEEESTQSSAPAIQRKLHIVKNAAPLDIVKAFLENIKSGSIISCVLEQLVDPIVKLFEKSSQKRNLINHVDTKLEIVWNAICSCIERYYLGPRDSEFLALMSPLLEVTFSHPRRNFKEKSRRFWFATFAPNASTLTFPESLKNVLKKMKIPLLPDDISPMEFSFPSTSSLEDNAYINLPIVPKQLFKTPLSVNGEASKEVTKENKKSKISIDELSSQEFVKIDTPVSTPRGRNSRKRKSYIPTLYNDLSQDTATLLSCSSESQDTVDSASLEQNDVQESVKETKATSGKELENAPSTCHKDVPNESKSVGSVADPSLTAKFEEKLNRSLRSDKEFNLLESSESDNEMENQGKKKLKLDSSDHSEENIDKKKFDSKMSVFSKPGEEQLVPRITRKNSKLSQSFSVPSTKKESEKFEYQKMNKSCVELIDLSDSEDIIPSSQGGSSKIENNKFNLNSIEQNPQVADNSICVVEKQKSHVSLTENKNGIDCEKSKDEDLNFKIITSTPSKSKIAPLIDEDMECEIPSENSKDVSQNIMLPANSPISSDKPEVSSDTVKAAGKDSQDNASKCIVENSSEVQCHSDEVVKKLDFLLDAVDNLVNTGQVDGDIKLIDEKISQSPPDIEMKDVAKPAEIIIDESSCIQTQTPSENKPVIKRSRLSQKLPNEDSNSENYSQKLRKKNINTLTKAKSKVSKKKLPKNEAKLNKHAKDTTSQNEIREIKSTDLEQTCDHEKSKTGIKDKEISLSSENLKVNAVEMTHLDTNEDFNLIAEQTVENLISSVDNVKILNKRPSRRSAKLNKKANNAASKNKIVEPTHTNLEQISDPGESKTEIKDIQLTLNSENSKIDVIIESAQLDSSLIAEKTSENSISSENSIKIHENNIENAESCEIFEASPENFKESEDNSEVNSVVDMVSVDTCDLGDSLISQVNEVCESQSETPDGDENAIIPSSLDASSKFTCRPMSEKTAKDSEMCSNLSTITPLPEIVNNSASIRNEMTAVQFSVIEDDLSSEMHNIVNSVVGGCSPKNLKNEGKSTASSQNEDEGSLQFSIASEENVSNSESEKPGSSIREQSECNSKSSEMPVDVCTDNSSDVISSNVENELESSAFKENSLVMDFEDPENNFKNANLKDEENLTEPKITESTEKVLSPKITESTEKILSPKITESIEKVLSPKITESTEKVLSPKITESTEKVLSENNGRNLPPEIDHSYSISDDQQYKLFPPSHLMENGNIEAEIIAETLKLASGNEMDVQTCDSSDEPSAHTSYVTLITAVDNALPIKMSVNSSSEEEIKCIIKDLVVRVEELNYNHVSNYTQEILASNDAADKENQALDIPDAKGSKKRKIKPPIRSPFNFRQRGKTENSKKLLKGIKSLNVSQIKSIAANKDLIIRPVFPENEQKSNENTENSMAKIISSIVDSVTKDDDDDDEVEIIMNKEINPNVPSSSQITKAARFDLSNDELTDLNTRLNASTAPQTRRSKMIAASHKTTETTENEPLHSNVIVVSSENSENLSSILKKRKTSMSLPPAKARKVTFAHPLITEVLIESISSRDGNRAVTETIKSFSKKNKTYQGKNKKTVPIIPIEVGGPIQSDDVPSSSEYQDSDVLDFSDLPVSPALINCPDSISNILKDLTSPSWIRGLESLLTSKNIKTIGDVCKLNIHQVKALPFKSPKVLTLHKALMAYIDTTQEATLQKIKTIDDGSFVEMEACSSSSSDSNTVKNMEVSNEDMPKSLEEAVLDVLKKERLKELPLSVLGQLIEACGKAVVAKNNTS